MSKYAPVLYHYHHTYNRGMWGWYERKGNKITHYMVKLMFADTP